MKNTFPGPASLRILACIPSRIPEWHRIGGPVQVFKYFPRIFPFASLVSVQNQNKRISFFINIKNLTVDSHIQENRTVFDSQGIFLDQRILTDH